MARRKGGGGLLTAIGVAIGGLALWSIFSSKDAGASTPPQVPPFPTTVSLTGLVLGAKYTVDFYSPPDYKPDQVVSALASAGFSEIVPGTPASQFNGLHWTSTARWVSPADHTTIVAPWNSLNYRVEASPIAA